jgi:hypothetical protein
MGGRAPRRRRRTARRPHSEKGGCPRQSRCTRPPFSARPSRGQGTGEMLPPRGPRIADAGHPSTWKLPRVSPLPAKATGGPVSPDTSMVSRDRGRRRNARVF